MIVNILCFHAFMAPSGLPLALLVTILWAVVWFNHRSAFAGLFQQRVNEQAPAGSRDFAGAVR